MKNLTFFSVFVFVLPSFAHASSKKKELPAAITCVGNYREGKTIKITGLNTQEPKIQLDQDSNPNGGVEFEFLKHGKIYFNYNDGCEFGYVFNFEKSDLIRLKNHEIDSFAVELNYTNMALAEDENGNPPALFPGERFESPNRYSEVITTMVCTLP